MYLSYLVVLFYYHFIWFYLTCLNEINVDGDGVYNVDVSGARQGLEVEIWLLVL